MVLFHIVDAMAQDEEEKEKTETMRIVSYESDGTVETDDEYHGHGKQRAFGSKNMEKLAMVIHLFGATAEGTPVRANVYGFRPYFYVELPNKDTSDKRLFKVKLKDAMRSRRIDEKLVGLEWVSMKKLYGYTGGRDFTFAKLSVASIAAFRAIKRVFLEPETSLPVFRLMAGGPPLRVYDSNLDPMLRFFHMRDIAPCGWVSIDAEPDDEGHIDCDWEIVCAVKNPPLPSAPFLLAIWDIECYSATGDFPVAERGDPIIQIGVVLVRAGKIEGKHIFVRGTCDEVPGATVHANPTEKGVLEDWAAAMQQWNPDVLIGYNTFGFDEKYLWKRAEKLGLTGIDAIQSLSRLADCGKEVKLEEKRLSSSALGDNYLYTWTTHGRVQVDLYHYVKRGYNLPSYKLDSVCQHFMSGKLTGVDVSAEAGKWILRTKSTGDVIPGRYVVLLDETGDVAVDKLKVLEIRAGSAVVVEAPTSDDADDLARATADAVKWAVVKDDVSPADIFRLDRGSSADRARVAAYCVQDCDLTYELYKKLDVFNNAMAMANTCPVPITYIFMRGQGIKIESLIYKECLSSGQVIETLPNPNRGGGAPEESYEGAIVLDPEPGFYFDSPVGVADFASLYPSTIESENISHDSLIWVEDRDTSGKFLKFSFGSKDGEGYLSQGVTTTEIDFDIWGNHPDDDAKKHPRKIVVGKRKCCYAKLPGDAKGTLPTIVQKLLAARKSKRKEAEKESDPFRKALLDAEQLAYKLTANSLYGQLGSSTFKIRLQHLAASVTAYGRKQILFAKRIIERFYGPEAKDPRYSAETVYGDTDSLFINFNPRDPATGLRLEGLEALKATMALTEEAGKRVTKYLAPPHDFEYDKVFYPFIIFSKKRYVGNKYEEDPEHYSQTSMGIATKRRDNAPLVKTIYGGAIRTLLNERDIPGATAFVQQKTMELVEGRMSMNQLTISKSLRAEYKTPSPPAHKMLADRIKARDPGNAPASGDRIPYVYIAAAIGQEASKLQGDRIENPSYVKEKGLKLDARYYIEHQLMNPLIQLFALCLEQMPGFKGPVDPVMRESAASSILFDKALDACNKESRKQLAAKFGMTVVAPTTAGGGSTPRPSRTSSTATTVVPVSVNPPKKQTTMDKFIMDSMLIEAVKSAAKKKAAAATATTAAAAAAANPEATTEKKKAPAKKKGKTIEVNV
jgi:DNA polymerase elongation subunit (family B)